MLFIFLCGLVSLICCKDAFLPKPNDKIRSNCVNLTIYTCRADTIKFIGRQVWHWHAICLQNLTIR